LSAFGVHILNALCSKISLEEESQFFLGNNLMIFLCVERLEKEV